MSPRLLRFAAISLSLLPLGAIASAQGSDACSSAQALVGTGPFPFDTTAASTGAEGQGEAACNFFGQLGIANDVWFTWTATASGTAQVRTCALATFDTKVAVYDGAGCPTAPAIACNDDACGLQSSLTFACTQGSAYTIQLGSYPVTAGSGTGSVEIGLIPPPSILATMVNPANGHTYHFLSDASWTVSESAAVGLGGHLVTVDDQAEHDWIVANFHSFQGVDRDIWIGLNDAAAEGTFVWSSGAPVGFTSWDLNEPNDGVGGEDYATMRKNNPNALWNDLMNAPTGFHGVVHGLVEIGGGAITEFCAGDGTLATACPCANTGAAGRGCDNSTGNGGASLDGSGSTSPDTVVLQAAGELPTATSIFLQGNAAIASGIAFGDGVRCVGGSLKRIGVKTAIGGATSYPQPGDASISAKSAALGDPIAPGSTRWYQTYYRDPNLGFCPAPQGNSWNVTNGVQIAW